MKTVFYVPVYDQVRELPAVLDAIRLADLEDVTFLLVDNGSSDGSERLIAESDHPTLHLPVNRGVGYGYIRAVDWALVRLTTGARVTDATNGFRAFSLDLLRRAQFEWHGEWLHTYAFEYFLYAKALLANNVRTLEVPTTMRYPKSGPYSKIRPGVDYVAMLKPWVMARLIPGGFA